MSFERIKFYKRLVVDAQLDAPAMLRFYVELPGLGLRQVRAVMLPATAGRAPIKVALPGSAKGRYAKVSLEPTGTARLYGMLLLGRMVGQSAPASWSWAPGPVDPTSEGWTIHPLPIPPTPEDWETRALPVPPTSDDWETRSLGIPPTSDDWALFNLPVPHTADEYVWTQIPVDA